MAIAVEPRETVTIPVELLSSPDAQAFPPGIRYELIDGVLLVSPGASLFHQRVVGNLLVILREGRPPGHEALVAPFDWYVDEWTYFEPDLVVVRTGDVSARRYEAVPLLVVEVLSPSSRLRDVGMKLDAYSRAGLQWYWVVDPDEPSLTVFRASEGRLTEQTKATGDSPYHSTDPVVAKVVPAELIRP